ncbi:hypothetical protein AVEN_157190-1 [Araneus ventricosus]|uniref:L-Fucosyltransferase n=1 Tax=Araneus ventricosus TaxID=182803 RepID=A0A4Y2U144_ARAVE|nr:hypothetical protein AVEN_157190-1 [Araneus ventricosus]
MVFTIVFFFGFRPVRDNSVDWNGINAPGGFPLLTIHTNQGRLGNQMFTFATLYGLGRLNHRSIALMPSNYEVLQKYFDVSIFPVIKVTTLNLFACGFTVSNESPPALSVFLHRATKVNTLLRLVYQECFTEFPE